MRTSLSNTTGRGVLTGTASGMLPDDSVLFSVDAGASACPNMKLKLKNMRATAEKRWRIEFFLSNGLQLTISMKTGGQDRLVGQGVSWPRGTVYPSCDAHVHHDVAFVIDKFPQGAPLNFGVTVLDRCSA